MFPLCYSRSFRISRLVWKSRPHNSTWFTYFANCLSCAANSYTVIRILSLHLQSFDSFAAGDESFLDSIRRQARALRDRAHTPALTPGIPRSPESVCANVFVRACACVRARARVCVYVCVCARAPRERVHVSACTCTRVRW
jgi:hypothetical protein